MGGNKMKRKLFFWLESLKITKAERVSVTVLMALLLLVTLIRSLIPVSSPYNDQHYAALEAEFKKRTEILRQKENAILARYHTEIDEVTTIPVDTIPADTNKVEQVATGETTDHPLLGRVNINTADAKTLERLPGIGPAYASRIIEYRLKNGAFTSYDELLKIKGIGKKRLEKLLPFIQL